MTDRESGTALPGQPLLVLSVALAAGILLRPTDVDAAPALPGEPCQVKARATWSETEEWVWDSVCVGEIADLNAHFGRDLDPRSPEQWTDERKLSSAFLEIVLLHDPWRNAVTRRGLRIDGAWFADELNFQNASIAHLLSLEGSRFDTDVNLLEAAISSTVSLQNSTFGGSLNLSNAEIGGDLNMNGGLFRGASIDLRTAQIDGVLGLIDAEVVGLLQLNGATLDGALLRRGRFGTVDAISVSMARNLELDGAKVTGALIANGATIGGNVFIRHGADVNDVFLRGARVADEVNLSGAKVTGTLNMGGSVIGQSLVTRSEAGHSAEFNDVALPVAKVGGHVDMIGAKVVGTLNMDSAVIGRSLFMRSDPKQRAEFNDVNLSNASISGIVDLIGAKVVGTLNMDSAVIGQNLFMRSDQKQRAEFNDVALPAAKVGGQVSMVGAKVTGTLNMEAVDIGQYLSMRAESQEPVFRTEFDQLINLAIARIGGGLTLKGAALSHLNLSGATIEGDLTLASPSWSPLWRDDASLVLRNTSVHGIGDTAEEGVWPLELDLDGFTYRRFGGIDSGPNVDVAARGSEWFIGWLSKDEPYTPQPYQQCAKVLREMGHPEMADDVLYAGRERERAEVRERGNNLRWVGLSLLKWTIGYGHGTRYFWALYWVIGLVLIATIVLGVAGQNQRDDGKTIGLWYSLDMLLPIIRLREKHYDIDLEGFARYWFYGHKIMGYVLASFLIAGLAGLTK